MKLENYRPSMNEDVLKIWAKDAQVKVKTLFALVAELKTTLQAAYEASPEGRAYLDKMNSALVFTQNGMSLEPYRETMTYEVLQSWGHHAQAHLTLLEDVLNELKPVLSPTYEDSPDGRTYLQKIEQALSL